MRAVFEGVTFGLSYALRALQRSGVHATEISLVGGGAGSDGWAQLCADIFALPVARPPQTEAGALGAARQARWAVDGVAVNATPTGVQRFQPVPSPGSTKQPIARTPCATSRWPTDCDSAIG